MALLGEKPAVEQSQRAPVVMTTGLLQPSLFDLVMQDDGSAFGTEYLTAILTFYMRPLLSRTPVINGNAAVIVNPPLGDDGFNIRYDWQPGDTNVEGNYMGWWGIDITGVLQETPEFRIIISDHGPGLGTHIGAVVDGIGQWMPVTFNALRDDDSFGDRFFQRFADRAKRETLGYVDTPDLEEAYDPQLIDYLSKLAAMHLCLPARDFWARQWRTRTTQSPVTIASYPDMLASLTALQAQLACELPDDLRQLRLYVPSLPVQRISMAPVSTLEDFPYKTPNPSFVRRPSLGGPRWGG